MFKNIRHFILEDELDIHIYKNKVNVVNYSKIGHFDSNKVIIYYNNEMIIINGNNLTVSKLVTDEVLIKGKIINIEFRWQDE